MTGVQVFLMGFGAVLAVIGVVVFFLLAWFKETTGQDHHNAIKILQAEFRFSNPALVIFAGGLLLMVAPFFIGNSSPDAPPPTPMPVVQAAPTATPSPVVSASPAPTPAQPTAAPVAVVAVPTDTPAPPTLAPTSTLVPPTLAPTLMPTPTIFIVAAPDPTGWWRNEAGSLEFRRLQGDEFAYSNFNSSGIQVGRGTATQYEDTLHVSGEESGFDGVGNPYYLAYTGYMILDGDVLTGDLYEAFSGIYLSSVFFTRDSRGSGQ